MYELREPQNIVLAKIKQNAKAGHRKILASACKSYPFTLSLSKLKNIKNGKLH